MDWRIWNWFQQNKQITAQPWTVETARPYFLPAIEDAFDLKRGKSHELSGLQLEVPSRNLLPIGRTAQYIRSDFEGKPKRHISIFSATSALSDFVKRDATVVNEVFVTKLLDFALACPSKEYCDNKETHGEQNNPFIYMGELWKFIGVVAETSPHFFGGDEVKDRLQQFFGTAEKLRHQESVKCVSDLYFKTAQLTPREYLGLALSGLRGDFDSPHSGIYAGEFFKFIPSAFDVSGPYIPEYPQSGFGMYGTGLSEDMRRNNVLVSGNEYNRGFNYLFPQIAQQQDKLVAEISPRDMEALRTLARDETAKDPFKRDCEDLSLKIIGVRPDLAIESDLINLAINTEAAHSPESLHRKLGTSLNLAGLNPGWNWEAIHDSSTKLAEKLKNPKPYNMSISIGLSGASVSATRMDDPTAMYLLRWSPQDTQMVEELRTLCEKVTAATSPAQLQRNTLQYRKQPDEMNGPK